MIDTKMLKTTLLFLLASTAVLPAVTTAELVHCSCIPFFVMYTVDAHPKNKCFNGWEFDAVKAMSEVSLGGWLAAREPACEEVHGAHAVGASYGDDENNAEEEEAAGYLAGSKDGYTKGMNQGFEQGYYEIVKADVLEDQFYGSDDSDSDSGSSEGSGTASSGTGSGPESSGSGSIFSSNNGSRGRRRRSSSDPGSRRRRRRLSEEEQKEEEQQETPVVVPTSATMTPVEEEFRALQGESGEEKSIYWMMGYVTGYKTAFDVAMEDAIELGREMGQKATMTDYDLGYEYGQAESQARKLMEENLKKNDKNNNRGRNLHKKKECPLPFQKPGYDCVKLDTLDMDSRQLRFLSHAGPVVDVITPNSAKYGLDFKNLLTDVMRGACLVEEVQFELWQSCYDYPEA